MNQPHLISNGVAAGKEDDAQSFEGRRVGTLLHSPTRGEGRCCTERPRKARSGGQHRRKTEVRYADKTAACYPKAKVCFLSYCSGLPETKSLTASPRKNTPAIASIHFPKLVRANQPDAFPAARPIQMRNVIPIMLWMHPSRNI